MQPIPVAEYLVCRLLLAQKNSQDNIVGSCRSSENEERCGHETHRQVVSYCHFAAVCSAYCSIAAATPSSSFEPVMAQPRAFNSGTPLPITTGTPAKDSISMSLWLSPMARISCRKTPRRPAHSARAAPFETEG